MTDFRNTPADHLGTVTRDIHDGERDGAPLRVLVVTREFAAPADEVWSAVTSPDRIPRWLGPVTGDFRVGGRFQVENNAGGEVLTCDAPTHLAISWEYGGHTSWVDVTLSQDDGHTRLSLEHSAPVTPEMWEQFGPGAVGIGWEMMLMGVAEHLEDPGFSAAEAQAAFASPDGRAWIGEYMTASSAAWGRADAGTGTDPAQAEAAAARCLAAYTGTEDASG